jgi:hypothetical protein
MNDTFSRAITLEVAARCERFQKAADKEARRIMKEMQAEIASTAPPPYTAVRKRDGTPFKTKHMAGGWKTSAKKRRAGMTSYTSYGVYNENEPTLTHLVTLGHRVVAHGQDTGKRTAADPFMDNARDRAQEKLNEAVQRLLGEFGNGE